MSIPVAIAFTLCENIFNQNSLADKIEKGNIDKILGNVKTRGVYYAQVKRHMTDSRTFTPRLLQ
ncbi:MAG: hypothetical protein FWC16_11775, partial [Defluviitaleaceae bacterium]|nr:hypothetical protein [Defluviitaleaceae bacterium]MCL2275597.1 hypothetical protein [Defluviitaleaceae bacterium]